MGRIVVNFEPGSSPAAAARPKRRRRWVKVLGVLALLIVVFVGVVAIAGFFSWRRFQSSPEYSLALLVDAAQRNNADELAKRLDDEEIVRNMVGRVSQKASDRYGLAITTATKQQIDQIVSSSSDRFKQTIHDEIAKEIKTLGAGSEPKTFPFLLVTISSLMKITIEGDIARAAAALNNRTFELMMRRDGDRWKVIGFNDDRVVQSVVDSVMKDLPPISPVDSRNPLFKNPGKSRKKPR